MSIPSFLTNVAKKAVTTAKNNPVKTAAGGSLSAATLLNYLMGGGTPQASASSAVGNSVLNLPVSGGLKQIGGPAAPVVPAAGSAKNSTLYSPAADQPSVRPAPAPVNNTSSMSPMSNMYNAPVNNSEMPSGQPISPINGVYKDIASLQQQRADDYLNRQGLYSNAGVPLSPSQEAGIRGSADDVYSEKIAQKVAEANTAKATQTSGYGINSALAGLPTNAVNLVYKMADDFKDAPIVKNFNTVQSSAIKANNMVNEILKRPGQQATAGDDMSLMYLFAKAQDPDSVVRESEYDNVAQYFSNLPANVQFKLSTLYKPTPDGRLTAESRQAMLGNLNTLYNSQKEQYDNLKGQTENRINQIAGKEVSDLFLNDYAGAYNQNPSNTDIQSKVDAARSAGYSDEEINQFLQSQGFNQVGNTSASVQIPQSSRLSSVNNNPGNLRFAGQKGATQGEGGFARFASPNAGLTALSNQVALDTSRGHTLASFINKFAPPTENNTNQYIQQAVAKLGVAPNTPLAKIPHEDLVKFIALKESGTKLS